MSPVTPPPPAQIITTAQEHVNNVISTVASQLSPVANAVEQASQSVEQTGHAFTNAVNQGFAAIHAALQQALTEIRKQQGIAAGKLHDIVTQIPDITLPSLITINGKDMGIDPDALYTSVREILNRNEKVKLQFRGPLFAPLHVLGVAGMDHTKLRQIVLPAFGLPLNSRVLNSDPVTITALIVIGLIVLGLPLTVGFSVAIVGIF